MSKKSILIGLLAAAAAGAIAGILLAPGEGARTRKKLSGKGKETVDGIKKGYNNFVDTITNKFSGSTDGVSGKS